PLGGVHGRADRANLLAGRLLALLAQHGLVLDLWRLSAALVVAIDAQPVHLAAHRDTLFADHGDVVLGLAGDDATAATGALVEVDRHAPLVALVVERGLPHVEQRWVVHHVLDVVGVLFVVRVGRLTHQLRQTLFRPVTPDLVDGVQILSDGEILTARDLAHAGPRREVVGFARAQ